MSEAGSFNPQFGPMMMEGGRTRFRLWAPAQETVTLEIDGRLVPMARRDGWFHVDVACVAGARYRYRLANGNAVPDPASRAQADDVHGPSLVTDSHAYRWQTQGWRGRPWQEAIFYELHVGLLGGFRAVARELP